MTSRKMWMVRSDGGALYDLFRERSVVAVGWRELAPIALDGFDRQQLAGQYLAANPGMKEKSAFGSASQVWRFVNEISVGDSVITYSPQNRVYSVGTVNGNAEYHPEWLEDGLALARLVTWDESEVPRDQLTKAAKNTLGSTLTLFEVNPQVAADLTGTADDGKRPNSIAKTSPEATDDDPFTDIETQARERIKDRINELDWSEMQELVAGVLRAMNYKTQISPTGPDRGKDIVASPDGFGFENPRIVVEVKHRTSSQMGSKEVRSFLGGRHKDDRGLYVSTGGFSKDAYYEAERASIPLQLWTLEDLARALVEHYDETDTETKRLIPLKRLYWTA